MTVLAVLWWIIKLVALICVFVIIMCVLAGLVRTLAETIDPPRKRRRMMNEFREELELKAHITEKVEYEKYRNDPTTVGEVLDIYDQAKAFMITRVTKEHGGDVAKWPEDVSNELRSAFAASDMIKDIMMALHKQQKEADAASVDEHSPVYKEEPENEDKE